MQGSRERRSRRTVWKWIGASLLLAGLGLAILFVLGLRRATPMLRARLIDTLSARFNSRVELRDFEVRILRGFEASGHGLALYAKDLNQSEPMFAVDSFSFHTGWLGLLWRPTHVRKVELSGLNIRLPARNRQTRSGEDQKSKKRRQKRRIEIVVDEFVCSNAEIVIETDKPGKEPRRFDIRNLDLRSTGAGRPLHFDTVLINPKPTGDIRSSGTFGPFDEEDPGEAPVRGDYTFTHADLNTIKGIGGMLSSRGRYSGKLSRIEVDGTTDTPNFSVDVSGRAVHLTTQFHAIVDGTNGDTYLQPVRAHFLHSSLTANGYVETLPGGKGHHIFLDVATGEARIEDLLELAVKAGGPAMRGAAQLHTRLEIPPGPQRIARKMKLAGRFAVRNATFSNPAIQTKVDEMSLRAQGAPEKAVREGKDPATITVPSEMRGDFRMGNGRLVLTNLQYEMPGAKIALQGFYNLDNRQLDFFGDVRTAAHLSQMVGGWKSILLRPIDPLFAGHGSGASLPIEISGTRAKPHFGLDLHRGDEQRRLREEIGRLGPAPQ